MEAQDAQTARNGIVANITKQITQDGGKYSNWYCGITSDLESRLFGDHKVPRGEDYWRSFRKCHNDTDARAVETALIKLGCDGDVGGGDQTSVYVYAYLKTAVTDP